MISVSMALQKEYFIINNKKYNSNPDDDKNKITDDFNVEIMNVLSKFTVIDFDLINKLDIALCQNMYNFITDLISILIADNKLLIVLNL